ncbi:hypothetical protein SYNPS1DRAFT_27469 [Syncephalis pseudoplumigaleata]|uniref:Uncharacterized protein n=1 Tax=Syncephalis pseudoplumigaleata TaxID=1712513 RepID=A0A4V1J202_9FUNG|nr:hypothetical protein SYNPS1DRAFT_27469 [Syncephalis pseudoplumigaleata]|eukprot:RKP26849.1 hypothetical protein SYNPS1DRAFT_27469 [Syncephalis pseudoplumigaleata]
MNFYVKTAVLLAAAMLASGAAAQADVQHSTGDSHGLEGGFPGGLGHSHPSGPLGSASSGGSSSGGGVDLIHSGASVPSSTPVSSTPPSLLPSDTGEKGNSVANIPTAGAGTSPLDTATGSSGSTMNTRSSATPSSSPLDSPVRMSSSDGMREATPPIVYEPKLVWAGAVALAVLTPFMALV